MVTGMGKGREAGLQNALNRVTNKQSGLICPRNKNLNQLLFFSVRIARLPNLPFVIKFISLCGMPASRHTQDTAVAADGELADPANSRTGHKST
ncbi:hypothetical protein RRG08_065234 [Elysia crispata]|uniref:Uncharacterized protein n=1 Tax=Elysia crispata TaxID=231223 RepID=A0AAE1CYZ9_9GAST|nr:hypothetical protein RRG08_065234 [Elysia crispata]